MNWAALITMVSLNLGFMFLGWFIGSYQMWKHAGARRLTAR